LVLEVTNDEYKSKLLHSSDFANMLVIDGKNVKVEE
jgi:hypothetical protein